MEVTVDDLRGRMARRSLSELRVIAGDRGDLYTPLAIETARSVLALRSQQETRDEVAGPSAPDPQTAAFEWLTALPEAIRSALKVFMFVGAVATLMAIMVAALSPSDLASIALGAAATACWVTVIGILTERLWVRYVLVASCIGLIVVAFLSVISLAERAIRSPSFWSVAPLAPLLWEGGRQVRFLLRRRKEPSLDGEIPRYYEGLRERQNERRNLPSTREPTHG